MDVLKRLFELADGEYAAFQAKLTPGVDAELFIGVRVPEVRKLAKEIYKSGDYDGFLSSLPHKYYDENMLHGLILSEMSDFDKCISRVNDFLPYVDNWAVCDIMSPKCFKKHKTELLPIIKKWTESDETYTVRFGLEMLMSHYLDGDFRPEYLDIAAAVRSDEYYVKMMTAWFFATALAKKWDYAVKYIENGVLETWVHNKTIQKARESYRITDEQKKYLNGLKRTGNMKKIKIAMAELETLQTEYVKALDSLGAEAVLVGKDVNPEGFDGLLIPGGGDVNPKLYGEDNNGSCGINDELDDLQTAVLDKFVKAGKPVLGICRGHQLINVYFGGTLIQDINDKKTHTPEKDIPVKYHGAKNAAGSVLYNCYGGEMTVNSTHHQAVKTVGNDMTVTAVSDDGYVEGTAHKTLPVITVQWHPEKMTEAVGNNEYTHGIKLIAEFVKICSE